MNPITVRTPASLESNRWPSCSLSRPLPVTRRVSLCQVDARNVDGSTPLCDACSAGSLECVRILLEHGAKANPALTSRTTSPLHEACMGGAVAASWMWEWGFPVSDVSLSDSRERPLCRAADRRGRLSGGLRPLLRHATAHGLRERTYGLC